MAIVTTNVVPTVEVFPLTGFSEPRAEKTGLARGLAIVRAKDAAIALTGVGDNQEVNLSFSLPRNFSYALTHMALGVTATTALTYNFALAVSGVLFDATDSTVRMTDIPIGMDCPTVAISESGGTAVESATYKPTNLFSGVLRAIDQQTVFFFLTLFNKTTNDGAYTIDFYAEFLQYDINQSYHVTVNSPIPVR